MTEYIIACDEEVASWIGNDVDSMKRVVRCRDCKHYDEEWPSKRNPERHWCEMFWHYLEPDGFCAWGERR